MAIRHHLCALRRERLVTFKTEPRPYGRPAKLYHLSEAANRFFPDHHADLAVNLFQALRKAFGKRGLDRVVAAWGRRELASIKSRLPERGSLERKLVSLARARDDQGYLAAIKTTDSNTYLLIENHCPIRAAASACDSLCREELAILNKALGSHVTIERSEHLLSGARHCVYIIRAKET
jgi:predicted ArsR family transcriptional regulator